VDATAQDSSEVSGQGVTQAGYLELLSRQPFRNLMLANLFSRSGDMMYEATLMWLVLQTTGSTVAMGAVAAAERIPNFILTPIAGVVVDRVDRRRLLVMTDIGRALTIAVVFFLALTHTLKVPHLIAAGLVTSIFANFFIPAQRALMPQIAGAEGMLVANSLWSMTTQAIQISSRGLMGLIWAVVGPVWAIFYNALSFVISALLLRGLKIEPTAAKPESSYTLRQVWADLTDAFSFIARNRLLRFLVILAPVTTLFSAGIVIVMPAIFVEQRLGGGVGDYGFLAAAASTGMLAGSYLAGWLGKVISAKRMAAIGLISFGLLTILFGLMVTPWIAMVLWGLVGAAMMVANIPILTLYQVIVPNEVIGRVTAVTFLLGLLAEPISMAILGVAAANYPLPVIYGICGGVIALAGTIMAASRIER
jgi:MFS family permease